METPMMKKMLMSLAATMLMVAGFATSADAQRGRGGGPGVGRVGGAGVVGVRGGFVGAPGFRRAAFVGGPGWVGGRRWVGGPGWYGGRRWVGGPWWGYRRPFVRAGFIGAGLYGGYYGYGYGGCARWRWVATPWGPQWRLVNVCYAPVGYGYGGYPIGYYGGVY
jgi:hypothetical protein